MAEEKHCDFCKRYEGTVKHCLNRNCPFGQNAETIAYWDKMERLWLKTWKVKVQDYALFCSILDEADYFKHSMRVVAPQSNYYLYSMNTLPEDFEWIDKLFKEHNFQLEVTEYYANPFRPMPTGFTKPLTIPNPQTPQKP